jgi:glyoxylase-like metal-dependent hydrolase (beta-lactamase superfamily II)
MKIETIVVGPLQVNCYLLICEETGKAAVIDPGADAELIMQSVQRAGCDVVMIINTHGHFDHIGANKKIKDATGAELLIHADDVKMLEQAAVHASVYGLSFEESPMPDRLISEGAPLSVGNLDIQILHVPGHSPGSVCLHVGNNLIVGDVLFAESIGRTDLPGGDHDLLIRGIREKVLVLADETVVYPGHGPETSIGHEKSSNPFVRLS